MKSKMFYKIKYALRKQIRFIKSKMFYKVELCYSACVIGGRDLRVWIRVWIRAQVKVRVVYFVLFLAYDIRVYPL